MSISISLVCQPFLRFSMGLVGASGNSPNYAPWEALSLRLSRQISAPLLTVALSWRYEEEVTNVLNKSTSTTSLNEHGR